MDRAHPAEDEYGLIVCAFDTILAGLNAVQPGGRLSIVMGNSPGDSIPSSVDVDIPVGPVTNEEIEISEIGRIVSRFDDSPSA